MGLLYWPVKNKFWKEVGKKFLDKKFWKKMEKKNLEKKILEKSFDNKILEK